MNEMDLEINKKSIEAFFKKMGYSKKARKITVMLGRLYVTGNNKILFTIRAEYLLTKKGQDALAKFFASEDVANMIKNTKLTSDPIANQRMDKIMTFKIQYDRDAQHVLGNTGHFVVDQVIQNVVVTKETAKAGAGLTGLSTSMADYIKHLLLGDTTYQAELGSLLVTPNGKIKLANLNDLYSHSFGKADQVKIFSDLIQSKLDTLGIYRFKDGLLGYFKGTSRVASNAKECDLYGMRVTGLIDTDHNKISDYRIYLWSGVHDIALADRLDEVGFSGLTDSQQKTLMALLFGTDEGALGFENYLSGYAFDFSGNLVAESKA